MARLVCDGRELSLQPGQLVIDALADAGIGVPSSCRAGACQSCLLQATRGRPPAESQVGLKESLRAQAFFLACQARPTEDLEISTAGAAKLDVPARIASVERLAAEVLRVRLEPQLPFAYRAGQFLTLLREDGLARAYSLASLPSERLLELHVRVIPGGQMSAWLGGASSVGSAVRLRGPSGECCYLPGLSQQTIVLVGIGTGLAPLWGVLRDALAAPHRGPIELWHGARTPDGLYLIDELTALQAAHRNFRYHAYALESRGPTDVALGRLDEVLLAASPSFAGRRVYLCGDAPLVQLLKRKVFLAGASLQEVHADPFVSAK